MRRRPDPLVALRWTRVLLWTGCQCSCLYFEMEASLWWGGGGGALCGFEQLVENCMAVTCCLCCVFCIIWYYGTLLIITNFLVLLFQLILSGCIFCDESMLVSSSPADISYILSSFPTSEKYKGKSCKNGSNIVDALLTVDPRLGLAAWWRRGGQLMMVPAETSRLLVRWRV